VRIQECEVALEAGKDFFLANNSSMICKIFKVAKNKKIFYKRFCKGVLKYFWRYFFFLLAIDKFQISCQ
jgi:hypothetical protein